MNAKVDNLPDKSKQVTSLTGSQLEAGALAELVPRMRAWARELGFNALGITDTDLSAAEPGFLAWLAAGFHGEMEYMAKHRAQRLQPAELVAGTVRVISVRMPYLSAQTTLEGSAELGATQADWRAIEAARLEDPTQAVISIYARGRDYHKVLRQRLQKLADRIQAEIGPFGYRAFTDSAPVFEVALAQKAHLGWRGKHTLLLHRDEGSLFFLGEIFVDLPLSVDASHSSASLENSATQQPTEDGAYCGRCTRCIDVCPTGAIVAPYRLDARRCISYLTIELKGSIPEPLRPLLGNRVYGCDDCQLVCPWNKFARPSSVGDFAVRNRLDQASLIELFAWSESDFEARLAGSAIRRIGYQRWLRNLAVGLGNARRAAWVAGRTLEHTQLTQALQQRAQDSSALVREHVQWALCQ
ncbi:tRNA epoxyqueuosine(34) reductase QueG [Mycoavidus sp. B2-EB]|uniref:tRNA epoxyqueuosine(34) reductase QueG n=1 Tax=Mycoavidus sp. B2-EB TaxID=2651972 RepID=UPI0016264307|nr:tRNA epoxyqueuosine(34) reductase QueG [Mycoavidus sp. B2-EB]BBO60404.1 Epoxyqueuosine reductase [Mycoavidus sp. B2-EB]